MKTAFGLDIAGYSTGRSALACAQRKDGGPIAVTVFREHAFANKVKGNSLLAGVVRKEADWLVACLRLGPVFIDAPLDLQGLPGPHRARFVWELTKRPIDCALKAMPPFAERIGAPVIRIRAILTEIEKTQSKLLGVQVFEVYPAASLELMHLRRDGYKGQRVRFEADKWCDADGDSEVLAGLANSLELAAEGDEFLTDDELDATLCALTGVVDNDDLLQGRELEAHVSNLVGPHTLTDDWEESDLVPQGYVLLQRLPQVRISIASAVAHSPAQVGKVIAG